MALTPDPCAVGREKRFTAEFAEDAEEKTPRWIRAAL
jgi:hypothetical protein